MESLLLPLQPLFAPAFTLWGVATTWTEVVASVMALVMVGLNMRVNPWAWPLAIVSSLLFFALFWQSRLYGEACLQIVFVIVAVWGWWQWLRGTSADGQALRVRRLSPRAALAALAALALCWPALSLFLGRYTDTDVPWWDALPTAASLLGQWLLGRKYIENWPTWVLVNLVSVALFAYKGLWLTTLLYALFVPLSFLGWQAWHRLAKPAP
jgi:nicotinamide mononucleotide transporter